MDELREWLTSRISEAFKESALEMLNEAADFGVMRAKQLVPVATGALQRSIRREPDAQAEANGFSVGVSAGDGGVTNPRTGREVDYAGHVEYGTSRMPPKPYLRPALFEAAQNIPTLFMEKVKGRLTH